MEPSERASEDISRLHLGMAFKPLPRRAGGRCIAQRTEELDFRRRARGSSLPRPGSPSLPPSSSPSAQPARAGQVRRSKALLKPARRVLSLLRGPLGPSSRRATDRQFAEICGRVSHPFTTIFAFHLAAVKEARNVLRLALIRCGPMQSVRFLELGGNPRKKGHQVLPLSLSGR